MKPVGITIALALVTLCAAAASPEKIFEVNVTNDLNLSSGEPQISVNPINPRNIAIIEFAVGSAKVPAYKSNPLMSGPELKAAANEHNGRVMLSTDGGNTWTARAVVLKDERFGNGADPAVAFAPDGTLYIDTVLASKVMPENMRDVSGFRNVISMSRDGGKTFSKPEVVESAPHRPWLKVDNRTGNVYLQISGFDPSVKVQTDPSLEDGWLVVWKPHLAAHSEPRRMGGPGFSGGAGRGLTVANGVAASTFIISSGQGANAEPKAVPAALQGLIKDGTKTCSRQAPCLFFQTTADEGRNWMRHHVPVATSGASYGGIWVAADPGLAGRYAIGFVGQDGSSLNVVVTDDSGATWSAPYTVPKTGTGRSFKGWMDYGPTGVLGFMWKQVPENPPPQPPRTQPKTPEEVRMASMERPGPAFDVYAAISCDGGKTWLPPARVNAETSPPGVGGLDDMSDLRLDGKYAHLVWGDTRAQRTISNAPGAIGGVQAYYGRVPFTTVSNGAACGRK